MNKNNKNKHFPKDGHFFVCEGCGKILDKREISCLSHGWIEGNVIVCYDYDLEPTSSKRVGESVLYTKNKDIIFLN